MKEGTLGSSLLQLPGSCFSGEEDLSGKTAPPKSAFSETLTERGSCTEVLKDSTGELRAEDRERVKQAAAAKEGTKEE